MASFNNYLVGIGTGIVDITLGTGNGIVGTSVATIKVGVLVGISGVQTIHGNSVGVGIGVGFESQAAKTRAANIDIIKAILLNILLPLS